MKEGVPTSNLRDHEHEGCGREEMKGEARDLLKLYHVFQIVSILYFYEEK